MVEASDKERIGLRKEGSAHHIPTAAEIYFLLNTTNTKEGRRKNKGTNAWGFLLTMRGGDDKNLRIEDGKKTHHPRTMVPSGHHRKDNENA